MCFFSFLTTHGAHIVLSIPKLADLQLTDSLTKDGVFGLFDRGSAATLPAEVEQMERKDVSSRIEVWCGQEAGQTCTRLSGNALLPGNNRKKKKKYLTKVGR